MADPSDKKAALTAVRIPLVIVLALVVMLVIGIVIYAGR
jgi:hypothetical protein